MLNEKVILINAISRSGSNILWNMMQSHPNVCSPISETNRLLHPRGPGLHRLSRLLYTNGNGVVRRYVDARLFRAKLRTLEHDSNRYRTETELYSMEDVRNAVLCLKALNEDIRLTDMFCSMYDDIHIIGLVRNGYAVCEGLVRRGEKPARVGARYARYMTRMIEDSQRLTNFRIVRFEELVDQPFETAESLFRFCELRPETIEKLRFKSKRIVSSGGSHFSPYKSAGGKYWFDRDSIREFMDPGIDESQSRRLSYTDRKSFEQHARPVLEYFSYV